MALVYLTAAKATAAMTAVVADTTNMKLSLHISTGPGNTGANKCAGAGYADQTGQFGPAASGTTTGPNAAVAFTSTAWTGTIGYFGVYEATDTTWQCGGALSATLVPPASCTVAIAIAGLSLSIQG